MDNKEFLSSEFLKRIEHGKHIYQRLDHFKMDGASKLKNKVKQELNFLQKCLRNGNMKKEHLVCSNLTHLEAVMEQLTKYEKMCLSVMSNKCVTIEDGSVKKICVDLVLHGGSVWMKVIARNPKALTIVSNGDGCYGQRSTVDQAEDFIIAAEQNHHFFAPPAVIFYFANGIEDVLRDELEEVGIMVEEPNTCQDNQLLTVVTSVPGFSADTESDGMVKCPVKELEIIRNIEVIKDMEALVLNLGVTTMIAYVSSLTNGSSHCKFATAVLNQHAAWERARPVKPILDQLFQGRKLFCCETAASDFKNILEVLGGPGERVRGAQLMDRVTVVADVPTTKLGSGGKIKDRSLAIFGTGEHLQAVTVTANHGFVRSAMNQGIHFAVFLHESRALTEGKEMPRDIAEHLNNDLAR